MVDISIRDDTLVVDVLGSHQVFAAGTFWSSDGWRFWDVRHPEHAITIELQDERLAEIIVEVEDPERDAAVINDAVRRFR